MTYDDDDAPPPDVSQTPPRVSILMATYNGSDFVRQSIGSLLAQTFRDFELIVVDDCSTDGTAAILAAIDDRRVKVHRNATNLGVVASRNRCLDLAQGDYIAMQDHDDLSRPTRLAKQVAFLDERPQTVLVATAANILSDGKIQTVRRPLRSSPALISWLLLVANPLVCSSVMFRRAALDRLETFMRSDYTYADDYDLYHRLMVEGEIARLDEPLTIYRQHSTMASRKHEDVMMMNAVRVLVPSYRAWFGNDSEETAMLVVRHLSGMRAVPDIKTMRLLKERLRILTDASLVDLVSDDQAMIIDYADDLWARVVQNARRISRLSPSLNDARLYLAPSISISMAVMSLLAAMPFAAAVRRTGQRLLTPPVSESASRKRTLYGRRMVPVRADPLRPPTMFVVVDTEAEFDWTGPMQPQHASVTAMKQIERGQVVFDRYGLRPVYVVDYPVATNPDSVAQLRAIVDRGGCEIGAHLHPWTTPPFEEELSNRNSYPGNLPPALEMAKLKTLYAAIEQNFGIRPVFYKAGRYGFGENTASILAELGFKVDFSLLPGADLRWRDGPNFAGLESSLYRHEDGVLIAPMTRSTVGMLPVLGRSVDWLERSALLRRLPVRSIFARSRVTDTITLTPEGVTTAEQIRLIKALLRGGQRMFVLHYHSPSLVAGNTSYAPDEVGVERLVTSLADVCAFFFEEVGGMPGFPQDLLLD